MASCICTCTQTSKHKHNHAHVHAHIQVQRKQYTRPAERSWWVEVRPRGAWANQLLGFRVLWDLKVYKKIGLRAMRCCSYDIAHMLYHIHAPAIAKFHLTAYKGPTWVLSSLNVPKTCACITWYETCASWNTSHQYVVLHEKLMHACSRHQNNIPIRESTPPTTKYFH
jgi:hypothetical protein